MSIPAKEKKDTELLPNYIHIYTDTELSFLSTV